MRSYESETIMTEPSEFDHLQVIHAHLALHDDVIAKLEARAARPDASDDQKTTIAAILALLNIDKKLIAHLAEENAVFKEQLYGLLDKITPKEL